MWYPQILQTINDFEQEHGNAELYMCNIVNSLTEQNISTASNCTVVSDNKIVT